MGCKKWRLLRLKEEESQKIFFKEVLKIIEDTGNEDETKKKSKVWRGTERK